MNIKKLAYLCEIIGALLAFFLYFMYYFRYVGNLALLF